MCYQYSRPENLGDEEWLKKRKCRRRKAEKFFFSPLGQLSFRNTHLSRIQNTDFRIVSVITKILRLTSSVRSRIVEVSQVLDQSARFNVSLFNRKSV